MIKIKNYSLFFVLTIGIVNQCHGMETLARIYWAVNDSLDRAVERGAKHRKDMAIEWGWRKDDSSTEEENSPRQKPAPKQKTTQSKSDVSK